MANVGEQLLQPESGWIGFDDSNINIKYDSNWMYTTNTVFYNSIIHYCHIDNGVMTFYVYGTKIRIIGNSSNAYTTKNIITIDGNDELLNCYSDIDDGTSSVYQRLLYEKLDLEKKIHKIEIKTVTESGKKYCIAFDRLDIDEDGYMVYCDENGKLYYDVTPIMTSNTTPAPYVASATNIHSSGVYKAYGAFDGDSLCGGINSVHKGIVFDNHTGSLLLDFSKKQLVNNILLGIDVTNVLEKKSQPTTFKIYGSNDNSIFTEIIDITDNEWDIKNNKNYNFHNAKYRFYKFELLNNNGSDLYTIVGELRYLLAIDTPFYLIQDNINNKTYNYDEENNTLMEVTDTSILKEDALKNICIYDLSKVIPLLDTLSDDLTILCNNDKNIVANGLKANKTLVIAKEPFSTRLAKNIDFFELISNISDTSSIKMGVSIDEGVTWKTWNGTEFIDLSNTCPLKEYGTLTEDEKTQWNTFMNEVGVDGINASDLKNIDFNILETDTMMFAYVFNRNSYEDSCVMSKLQYQFDAYGSYKLLGENDVAIKQGVDSISVTPNRDIELMKVNIGSSGTVNINNGEDIDFPTDEEIDNMVNEVINNVFA